MLEVTLFTKEGCHLCEEVEKTLALLQNEYPHRLHKVDITGDREVFSRYHYVIPVVRVGKIELEAPISRQQLITALAASPHE